MSSMASSRFPAILALALALAGGGACGKKDEGGKPAPAPAPHAGDHGDHAPDLGGDKPGAHSDHAARHGGLVLMNGDVHFEVLLDEGGQHKVWFSSAVREELPANAASSVEIVVKRRTGAPEKLTAAAEPGGAYWLAAGRPVDDPGAKATVTYTRQGEKPYSIDVPMRGMGTVTGGPHGGQVMLTAGGGMELVAAPDGTYKLWLLDPLKAPRAVPAGATATIKVAVPDYKDVELVIAGDHADHLEGKGAPLPAGDEHPAAVATLKAGTQIETARFTLHLEPEGHAHP